MAHCGNRFEGDFVWTVDLKRGLNPLELPEQGESALKRVFACKSLNPEKGSSPVSSHTRADFVWSSGGYES